MGRLYWRRATDGSNGRSRTKICYPLILLSINQAEFFIRQSLRQESLSGNRRGQELRTIGRVKNTAVYGHGRHGDAEGIDIIDNQGVGFAYRLAWQASDFTVTGHAFVTWVGRTGGNRQKNHRHNYPFHITLQLVVIVLQVNRDYCVRRQILLIIYWRRWGKEVLCWKNYSLAFGFVPKHAREYL